MSMRPILKCGFILVAAVAFAMPLVAGRPAMGAAPAPGTGAISGEKWVDAWGTSYLPTTVNGQLRAAPVFTNQTLRFMVFSRLAGTQARVKITNKFEKTPLVIGGAHIALKAENGAIAPETDRTLTFGGAKGVTVPPGEEIWSDGVTLNVPQHKDVAISIFIPDSRQPTAFHATALKNSYISATGDFMSAVTMPPAVAAAPAAPPAAPAGAPPAGRGGAAGRGGRGGQPGTTQQWFFVSGLQVMAPAKTKVIVALGDSITDGANSTPNTDSAWPDMLSKRLPALKDGTPVSVLNMGIGSNRFVSADAAGPAGSKRVDDDVLAHPNVTHLIIMEGINDISYEHAPAEQLIKAYQEAIAKAHAKGIKVFMATLLPIQNGSKDTPENLKTQQAVNKWIREGKGFDGVLDFEKVVQDPANPLSFRAELTSDHVHPNSAGYKLIADSVDLSLFEK